MDNANSQTLSSAYTDGLAHAEREGKSATTRASEVMNRQMQAATETAHGVSAEMFRYAGQRLHAHADNLQSLSQCHTPQAVMEQQMAFMRSSAQQFSQGVSSMFDAARSASVKQAT